MHEQRGDDGAWLLGDEGDPAVIEPESGTRLTYGSLRASVELVAAQLVALGIGEGDVVAFSLPNGPESIVSFLAVVASGAAAAPLNPLYSADEVGRYLADLRPRIMVLDRDTPPAAGEAARSSDVRVAVLGGPPENLRLADVTARAGTAAVAAGEQVALLLHTSGTTGRAKVVPLRRRNLTASARAVAGHYELSRDDVSHCVMPLFHVHGMVASTLAPFLTGGAVIAPRRFSASAFWAQGAAGRATWFSAVPTIHQILLEQMAESGPPAHRLRFARSCSAALPPSVMTAFEAAVGVPLVEAYGMTEAAHQMTSNPLPPGSRKPGSVGLSAGAEVCVVDDDWRPLPTGSVGEVTVRGVGVIDGYLENAEANAAAFRDGWFRTGDSGTLDADGYLHLRGRIKELINRGGEKISPQEVEDVLLRHDAVAEAAAYAIPDATYGEVVGAAVVVRGPVDERALAAHCGGLLAPFKVPTRITILDGIPKGPTGKVQRRLLAQLIDE